jgi:hypothetical protein
MRSAALFMSQRKEVTHTEAQHESKPIFNKLVKGPR